MVHTNAATKQSDRLSPAHLRKRAGDAIKKSGKIDDRPAFDYIISLLSYVSGDYNDPDHFHLVADVVDWVPGLGPIAPYVKQRIRKHIEHQ